MKLFVFFSDTSFYFIGPIFLYLMIKDIFENNIIVNVTINFEK